MGGSGLGSVSAAKPYLRFQQAEQAARRCTLVLRQSHVQVMVSLPTRRDVLAVLAARAVFYLEGDEALDDAPSVLAELERQPVQDVREELGRAALHEWREEAGVGPH